MVVASTSELVRSFYEDLWNRWDDALVDAVLSPGFAFRGSLGTTTSGRDGWRSYRDTVRAGSADFDNEVVTLVCDGDGAAARLRYSGTHTGTLLGLPATGRRFEYAGAAFFTAERGLLASAWVLGDLTALRGQLTTGATPA
jgi:predicted ester cyclase